MEYRLTEGMSAQVGYVGHHANHLVTPVEGNQALPGVGDPSTWAPKATRRPLYGGAAAHHDRSPRRRRAAGASTTRCRRACASARGTALEFMASYTSRRPAPTTAASTACSAARAQGVTGATEGAYWQNTYNPEAEWGPAFHDVRHNFVVLGHVRAALRRGHASGARTGAARRTPSSAAGSSAASSRRAPGLPVTVIDGRARSLQGERGLERPNCVGDR